MTPFALLFSCIVLIDIRVGLTHWRLKGDLVVDAANYSVHSQIYGDDPNRYFGHLNQTVLVLPKGENVSIWSVSNGVCKTYSKNKTSISKIELPSGSKIVGTKIVGGFNCTVWRVYDIFKSVKECDVCVYNGLIMEIYATYLKSSVITAYITVEFADHNMNPTLNFDVPKQCNTRSNSRAL